MYNRPAHNSVSTYLTMQVNSLVIYSVESQYTQEYIANVFWNQRIAKVSDITLIPYLKNQEIYNIAYILIDEWCDSEIAYNFITRLKKESTETRLIHQDEEWWAIKMNTHNNGKIYAGPYTVIFQPSYFERSICFEEEVEEAAFEEEEEEKAFEEEEDTRTYLVKLDDLDDEFDIPQKNIGFTEEWREFFRQRPIRDINNICYTVDEANEQLWILSHKKDNTFEEAEAIEFLRNELRIHEAVNNSQHVTLREECNEMEQNWSMICWGGYDV